MGRGQWFPQGWFFVGAFVVSGQVSAPKAPRFLAAKRCAQAKKTDERNKNRHKNWTTDF